MWILFYLIPCLPLSMKWRGGLRGEGQGFFFNIFIHLIGRIAKFDIFPIYMFIVEQCESKLFASFFDVINGSDKTLAREKQPFIWSYSKA